MANLNFRVSLSHDLNDWFISRSGWSHDLCFTHDLFRKPEFKSGALDHSVSFTSLNSNLNIKKLRIQFFAHFGFKK